MLINRVCSLYFYRRPFVNLRIKHALIIISALVVSLLIGSTYYYLSPFFPQVTVATAVIHPTKGNDIAGVVTFIQQADGLHITARITGLTPGKHGFHVHEFGNCACDDGICAGDHYNPTHKPHGSPESTQCHVGDFGNIIADENGVGAYEQVNTHATINGPFSLIGRTVIIHAQEDDLTTQPSGNSGARIGCGVIGIAKQRKK